MVFPADDLVRRVCPLIQSAAHPALLGTQVDVLVRIVVDISVGVGFVIILLLDLLCHIFRLGIYELVPPASRFYSSLFRPEESRWQYEQMAAALVEAAMEVRAGDVEMPLNWAQFIHYGP
jgi:hypothetical protein